MRTPDHRKPASGSAERGASIVELMVALIVLAVGILAVGQLFPAGTRSQQKDKMFTTAGLLAHEQLETLRARDWSHADLNAGAHGPDSVGTGNQYVLTYNVTAMAAPMDQVKRVDVTVSYSFVRPRSVTATTYIRR
jgi:Tfp pilus assembly protein PilV